jgi:peptide deformylase
MDANEITRYGDPVLRQRAEEIKGFDDEVKALIERMYAIMVEARGLGLAAPQVGVSKRIFTYDIGEGPHALINPRIVRSSGEEIGAEGCLSIPGLQGDVARAERVTMSGIDETGAKVKIKAEGLLARVFQHELDHLDGTVFVDKADPDTLETVPLDEQGGESRE